MHVVRTHQQLAATALHIYGGCVGEVGKGYGPERGELEIIMLPVGVCVTSFVKMATARSRRSIIWPRAAVVLGIYF